MDFREEFAGKDFLKPTTTLTADQPVKYAALELFLRDWQNPTEADKLLKIEKELQDVQNIVH